MDRQLNIAQKLAPLIGLCACVLSSALVIHDAQALPTAPRSAHPIGWMHQLPGGEAPGWISPSWTSIEYSVANVWNAPLTARQNITGQDLSYIADFEQQSTYIEKGLAPTSWFALALELAIARRTGGGLDTFIDDFHQQIDSNRFERQFYPGNQSRFQISTGDTPNLIAESSSGLSNYKAKLKFWPVKWNSSNSNCPCGIGLSFHAKFPASDPRRGLTSGGTDYSGLAHIGIPIAAKSAFFLTAGATALGENKALHDWPRKRSILLIDGTLDLELGAGFGLLLHMNAGSPLIDMTPMTLTDPSPDDPKFKDKRISTAWNSLMFWRIHEGLGFRWRSQSGAQISLWLTEDIGINDYDEVDDFIYVNSAPDIMASLQLALPL